MARQLRLEYEGALYHITSRGNMQVAIYLDDENRTRFLVVLGHEVEQQGWRCYAYCLIDNHYHLLVDVTHKDIVTRHNAESYRTAARLLRRAANLPLKDTADVFGVSPSRISHIQRILEPRRLTQRERKANRLCKTKQ